VHSIDEFVPQAIVRHLAEVGVGQLRGRRVRSVHSALVVPMHADDGSIVCSRLRMPIYLKANPGGGTSEVVEPQEEP
jgi:hypothetical protein